MPQTDLSGAALAEHRTSSIPPGDLDQFWADTLAQARELAMAPTMVEVESGLGLVRTFDVTFSGFGGEPVHAWFHVPAQWAGERLPTVVRYQGYGGGRGLPHQVSIWPLAGYLCLEVDIRGQGSVWRVGDTHDTHGSGASYPGFMTRGILDPATYYYRRVYTDAVLAIDTVRTLPGVDPDRLAVNGSSQGGGISLAVAGLVPGLAAVLSDVPFLSDFERAMAITAEAPYTELSNYLAAHRDHVPQVLQTLSYFDVSLLVATATAPALFSVALMDRICPPSTVYAAYNGYAGPKEICEYPYNDHEGGQVFHERVQLRWADQVLRPGLSQEQ